MSKILKCRICNSKIKKVIDLKNKIPFSVTSDAQVVKYPLEIYFCENCDFLQKESTPKIQLELFSNFKNYEISDGEEQLKMYKNKFIPRSDIINQIINKYINKNGTLLDIGTGNGVFLKSFKKAHPNWTLYGQDLQGNSINEVIQIIPKDNFIIDTIDTIDKKFDLISAIHVLNHICDLELFIKDIVKLLKENSQLLLQLSNIEKSISDIVIAEAINHFSKNSIYKLLKKYFKNVYISDIINGEITVLASNYIVYHTEPSINSLYNISNIISKFNKMTNFLINNKKKLSIFGTAPVGSFCGTILGDNIEVYVDEDLKRVGKKLNNHTIVHPKDYSKDSAIFLPIFDNYLANKIKEKYTNLKFITLNS